MTSPETHHNTATGGETPPHDHENDTVIHNTQSQQLRHESPIINQQQQQQELSSGSNCIDPSNRLPCVHCQSGNHEAVTMAEVKNDGGYLDSLPVGFRFVPTDDELLKYYLMKKIKNEYLPKSKISEADIYANHPKDIVGNYPQAREDNWYFFTQRNRKYPYSDRPARQAGSGYWKATGPDKVFKDDNGEKIGVKKPFVYYERHTAHWTKTKWMMHEYTIKSVVRAPSHPNDNNRLDDYVLCRIYINARMKDEVATDHQQSGVASLANLRVEHEQPDVGPTTCHGTNNVVIQDDCDQNLSPDTPDLIDNNLPLVGSNRHISPATVPTQRAHMVSNQDVNPTSFRVENNIRNIGSNSSNLGSDRRMDFHFKKEVKEGKRHVVARDPHTGMVPCWERILRPRVGWHHYQNINPPYNLPPRYFKFEHSFPTRFNYEYSMQHSNFAHVPQRPRIEHAPKGQARPVMYHIGSSSNPPPPKVAQHCQEGGDDDPVNRLKRNIKRMFELDGYDHLFDDTLDKLRFDGNEDVDADDSKKHT